MKIGHQQLQKYESGTVKPGAERLEAIADALETNVSYLLGRTDYERALTDKHYRLADAYDRGDRNAILDILRKHLAEQDFSEPVVPRVKPGPKRQSAKRR